MQGKKFRDSKMIYMVTMSSYVPENHILRLINKHVDFSFIQEKARGMYSSTGRPSIDPEVIVRMLLIGYLFGITSERKLCQEVAMHIGYRWFCRYALDEPVMDHSSFSKNRHGRFAESNFLEEVFYEIVRQCVEAGLVTGEHVSVDGTHIKANASLDSMESMVTVKMTPKGYLQKVKAENKEAVTDEDKPERPDKPEDATRGNGAEKASKKKKRGPVYKNKTHCSRTDPDARLAKKGAEKVSLRHDVNYLMDHEARVILGVEVDTPDRGGEQRAALAMLEKAEKRLGITPAFLGADEGYAAGDFLHALLQKGITPHIPIKRKARHNAEGIYPREMFTYHPITETFTCPQGHRLTFQTIHSRSRQKIWRAKVKDCAACPCKSACTRDKSRSISYHIHEDAIVNTQVQNGTPAYVRSYQKRKTIEGLFAEAKQCMGLGRAKFRRQQFVREQALLTATAQNIKRLVKGRKKREMAGASRVLSPFCTSLLSKMGKLIIPLLQSSIKMRYLSSPSLP